MRCSKNDSSLRDLSLIISLIIWALDGSNKKALVTAPNKVTRREVEIKIMLEIAIINGSSKQLNIKWCSSSFCSLPTSWACSGIILFSLPHRSQKFSSTFVILLRFIITHYDFALNQNGMFSIQINYYHFLNIFYKRLKVRAHSYWQKILNRMNKQLYFFRCTWQKLLLAFSWPYGRASI